LLDEAGLQRYTAFTVTSRSDLDDRLSAARIDGWARTVEDYEIGLNAMAAAVRDHSGAAVGAVSVSGPAYRLDGQRMTDLAAVLIDGAARISDRLGHLIRGNGATG
jgi:DNA-binding IclR family transcriptional regulator